MTPQGRFLRLANPFGVGLPAPLHFRGRQRGRFRIVHKGLGTVEGFSFYYRILEREKDDCKGIEEQGGEYHAKDFNKVFHRIKK